MDHSIEGVSEGDLASRKLTEIFMHRFHFLSRSVPSFVNKSLLQTSPVLSLLPARRLEV